MAQRLSGKPSGADSWMAACPAHNDERLALSIVGTSGGKAVLECMDGCTFEAIIAALGLQPQQTLHLISPETARVYAEAQAKWEATNNHVNVTASDGIVIATRSDVIVKPHTTDTNGEPALFPIQSAEAVEALTPPAGLIGDILYENEVTVLYADAGRWKTFIALSWACCVADGRAWLGRKVKAGDVLYVAAEGGAAIGPRVHAWKQHYGVETLARLHVLLVPVNLLQPAQVALLVKSIRALIGDTLSLIVLDTLSRSMAGGDESSAKDGSAALAAADVVRQAFGCAVLILAHPGYNDTHIRGWSGYFQWVDGVIKAHASDRRPRIEPGDVVTLTCEKPKNTEGFTPIHLTTLVERWTVEAPVVEADEDGADASEDDSEGVVTRSSLVIVAADKHAHAGAQSADGGAAKLTLPHSQSVVLTAVVANPNITTAVLVAHASGHHVKKTAVYDAVRALVARGWLTSDMDGIRITPTCPPLSAFSGNG